MKHKPRVNSQKKSSEEPARAPAANADARHRAPEPLTRLTPGKKAFFALIAFVLLAAFGLVALELAFRVTGYGYDTSFFRQTQVGGQRMLVENDKFGLRFFPPEMARSPAPVVMNAVKPAGSVRIFVFGESAALGDPKPAFGPARCMEKLLVDRFPGTRFEVICTAMTAINSHAILPIARECASHDGDIWLIYMGNNEMVGPFGAASVFGSQAPSNAYVRFILAVQNMRVGQWLMASARKVAGRSSGRLEWEGMPMFMKSQVAPKEPRKDAVYRNFAQNLRDILDAGHRAKTRILLNTVAVNVKDCAPFASIHGLIGEANATFQAALTNGIRAEMEGSHPVALKFYEQAARVAPLSAEAHFRYGLALLRSGKAADALPHLQQALDLDALPFRTDGRINSIIAQGASQATNAGIALFDTIPLLAADSNVGVPGAEVFYEHVHFNFRGNYLLGRAWAEQVAALLPPTVTGGEAKGWLTQEQCERKLGLTDWNRVAVYRDMLQRLSAPPFTHQINHSDRVKGLQTMIAEARKRMDTNAVQVARAAYAEALASAPNDHRLHENFAEFLEAVGDAPQALAEWTRVRELMPHHHVAYFQCGRIALRLRDLDQAEKQLTQAVTLRPDLAEGWLTLGQVETLRGNHTRALELYERERRLAPRDPRAYYHIGKACSNLGRRSEAIGHFQRAVQLNPAYWEAHYMLGEELAFSGETALAREQFETVIRLNPGYAMAHLNLGVALFQAGERETAIKHFEQAYRLDPSNKQAAEYLKKLR